MKTEKGKRIEMDFTNYSVFHMNDELTRDPRAPKTERKPTSKKFWVAVFSIIGVVFAFGIVELVMCALHGM